MLVDTYRRRLAAHAADQYGYVTTRDATELDIPPVELPKLAATGGLSHVAYGLWRFDDQPRTGRDQFMEAVLRVGADAYLTHDAVLAFHELAQVNPRRIRVGTPHRARARVPDFVEVVRQRSLTSAPVRPALLPRCYQGAAFCSGRPGIRRSKGVTTLLVLVEL